MRVDYEAAWTQLVATMASKTSWGRDDLLTKAAEIAADNTVPEDILAMARRVAGTDLINQPEAVPAGVSDRDRISHGAESPATDDQGGHDGNGSNGAGHQARPDGTA